MGKKIIITESQYNVLLEQNNSFVESLYGRMKNNKLFKKIENLYDENLNVFVSKVISEFPMFKKMEKQIYNIVDKTSKNPESFLSKNLNKVQDINIADLQEQDISVIGPYESPFPPMRDRILLAIIFFMIIIVVYMRQEFRRLKKSIAKQSQSTEQK